MRQVLRGFRTEYEDATRFRWNRSSTIRVHADPDGELPSELMERAKPRIERELGVDLASYFGRHYESVEQSFEGHNASTIRIVEMDQIPLLLAQQGIKLSKGLSLSLGTDPGNNSTVKNISATG